MVLTWKSHFSYDIYKPSLYGVDSILKVICDTDSTKQQVPIGRVYVEVPSVHVTQPKPAQLPTGGKRTLAAIQKGIEVYKPSIPKPKG